MQTTAHNTQQNLYDQRSIHVQVGADPMQVIQHVQPVESEAGHVVREAASHVRETNRRVEGVVHEAQQQAQKLVHEARSAAHQAQPRATFVEDRAHELIQIQGLNSRHHAEGEFDFKKPLCDTAKSQWRGESRGTPTDG